jgi:MarR family transcriptional regulator, 2-MHQ and catechol-resistance regulon repressor
MMTSQETAHDLLSILPLLNRIMIVELRQEGGEETTMPQFRVLSYLSEAPMTVSDVARQRRVSFQSAGELVQTLVERGWIERIADQKDRRQSLLHLTEAGQQAYNRAQEHMLERISGLLDALTEEEQAVIRRAMGLLQSVLVGEERDDRNTQT